jgi:hypothetical protein
MCLIAQTHKSYFHPIYNLNLQLFLSENITGSLFSTGRYPIDIIEIQKETDGRRKQTHKCKNKYMVDKNKRINVKTNTWLTKTNA